jgi:hypothetical protein
MGPAPHTQGGQTRGRGARRARRGVRDVVYLPTLAEFELWLQMEYGLQAFDESGA